MRSSARGKTKPSRDQSCPRARRLACTLNPSYHPQAAIVRSWSSGAALTRSPDRSKVQTDDVAGHSAGTPSAVVRHSPVPAIVVASAESSTSRRSSMSCVLVTPVIRTPCAPSSAGHARPRSATRLTARRSGRRRSSCRGSRARDRWRSRRRDSARAAPDDR
jgi:hypothetical protein